MYSKEYKIFETQKLKIREKVRIEVVEAKTFILKHALYYIEGDLQSKERAYTKAKKLIKDLELEGQTIEIKEGQDSGITGVIKEVKRREIKGRAPLVFYVVETLLGFKTYNSEKVILKTA
jgi:hypothetical protein